MGKWITKRTGLTPEYKVRWYSGVSSDTLHALMQHLQWLLQFLQVSLIPSVVEALCVWTVKPLRAWLRSR